jgi:hypothetical protein
MDQARDQVKRWNYGGFFGGLSESAAWKPCSKLTLSGDVLRYAIQIDQDSIAVSVAISWRMFALNDGTQDAE